MVWSYQEVYISLKASGRILNGGNNQFNDCTQEGGSSLWRDGGRTLSNSLEQRRTSHVKKNSEYANKDHLKLFVYPYAVTLYLSYNLSSAIS